MKKNLGKAFVVFLLFVSLELFASTYRWTAEINKKTAYVNEAIHLKYTCEFSDKSELYTIDFNPVGDNEKYSLKLLAESEKIINNKRVNVYEFVAFVKEAGTMIFDFNMIMKKTTQESIDSTIGGRDNDREIEEFSQRVMKQKSLVVDIKETLTLLVGNFFLNVNADAPQVKAYEPFHMEVSINGIGNIDALKGFKFDIENVKVFSSVPKKEIILTKEGYSGKWSQKFVFVSDEDFVIPEIALEYFNIELTQVKILQTQAIKVEVEKAYVKEELLDVTGETFQFSYTYFYYLLTFIAGFLVAKIKIKTKPKKENVDKKFLQKVANSKSLKELAIVLTLENARKYNELILEIERKESQSLKSLKKELVG